MESLWHNLIVAGLVVAASIYLVRAWLSRRRKGSCPDCQVHQLARKRQDPSKLTSRR